MQAFDAFISYSHRTDGLTAPALQKGLENFNRKWLARRRLRIFRDETDLSLAPSLWGTIQEALDHSRFFILLASPEAARSKWVEREVKRWIETKPAKNILLVITDGSCAWNETQHDFDRSASSAIPPTLFGSFSEEPLFLDLRVNALREYRSARAQEAIASLAAPIHGKSKQELLGLEIQLIRKRLLAATLALALIAALAAGFLWSAVEASRQRDEASRQSIEASKQRDEASRQRDVARVERDHAQSQLEAAQSTLALQAKQASPTFWHGVEAWRRDENWVAQKALYDFARTGLLATLEHGSEIEYATISLDGRYALTVGHAGGLKVWKVDGTLVFSADAGGIGGGSADISADNSRVVYTAYHPKVFDIAGAKQFELLSDDGNAWFSPDGRSLFTVAPGEPSRRWDMTGRLLNEYRQKGDVTCFAASADTSMVAAATAGGDVYLWSIDGRVLWTFHSAPVSSVEFSPDGSRLLSVSRDGALTMMNTSNGSRRVILDRGVTAAVISPQGNQIGVMVEKTIRLMNFDGVVLGTLSDDSAPEAEPQPADPTTRTVNDRQIGRALRVLPVDYRQIGRGGGGALRFVAGGRYIVSSAAGATRVWDLEGGRVRESLDGRLLAASPNGNYLITPGKFSALLSQANNALRSELPHAVGISSVGLAPSGGALVTASFDGKARVWDSDGNLTATIANSGPLSFVTFSHDGQKLLTVGRNGAVRLWSRDGERLKAFRHADIVSAAFAPDDTQIVTSSLDGAAMVRSLQDDRVMTLDHKSAVYSVAYSPDGRLLATGAADHTLRVWWAGSGSLRWQKAAPESVSKVAFSPDGQRVVATTTGSQFLIFETDTGRLLAEVKHPDALITSEVAQVGNLIVTSSADRVVRLWDLDGRRIAELTHSEPVRTLAVSRDGKRILTGSEDGRALLWDLQGNELYSFPAGDAVQQVAFSTDGENVVTVSTRLVRIWNFGSPRSIIEHYQKSVGKLPTETPEQPVHQGPQ